MTYIQKMEEELRGLIVKTDEASEILRNEVDGIQNILTKEEVALISIQVSAMNRYIESLDHRIAIAKSKEGSNEDNREGL